MSSTDRDPVSILRSAVARTQAAETARLVYILAISTIDPAEILRKTDHPKTADAFDKFVDFADRFVDRSLREHPSTPGIIDFARQRALYALGSGHGGWNLTAPGLDYNGGPGEWELETGNADWLGINQPFWMLALLDGATDAEARESAKHRREPCRVYSAHASQSRADERCTLHLGDAAIGDADPEHLPLTVWLDKQGRVRRIDLTLRRDCTRILELWDFDRPAAIDLPGDDEITARYDGTLKLEV